MPALLTSSVTSWAAAAAAATDAGYEGSMVDPADVARASLDGVERGAAEVLVDEWSRGVKASLQGEPEAFYAQFA